MYEKVENIISKIGTGATDPLDCLVNNKRAIVKTYNNDEGNKVLANEIIAYNIAKMMNMPIPQCGICVIDKYTEDIEGIIDSSKFGIGFYSKRLDKVTPIINNPMLLEKYVKNKSIFLNIIIFDHIIYNKDRHKGNLLLSSIEKQNHKLFIIDHSHIFNIGALWDEYQLKRMISQDNFRSTEIMEYNYGTYEILLNVINVTKDNIVNTANEMIRNINFSELQKVINTLPTEWGITKNEKILLYEYIINRINNIDIICDTIYQYVKSR